MNRLLLTFFCLLVLGCYQSNEFDFDINSQIFSSKNDKGITQLYVEKTNAEEYYSLKWIDTTKGAPTMINFQSLSGFKITTGYLNKKLDNSKFNLKPNSCYVIERAQGDATSYKLTVRTNNEGLIDSVWR